MKQVITISPTGAISGMDHKRKGLDLRQLGKAKIRRVTIIDFCEKNQMWSISWTKGNASSPLYWRTPLLYQNLTNEQHATHRPDKVDGTGVCYWRDYDRAVEVEVAVIQAMQVRGDEII